MQFAEISWMTFSFPNNRQNIQVSISMDRVYYAQCVSERREIIIALESDRLRNRSVNNLRCFPLFRFLAFLQLQPIAQAELEYLL